jgi:hypothetical protein
MSGVIRMKLVSIERASQKTKVLYEKLYRKAVCLFGN